MVFYWLTNMTGAATARTSVDDIHSIYELAFQAGTAVDWVDYLGAAQDVFGAGTAKAARVAEVGDIAGVDLNVD
jgi:hypothetical protein